MRSCRNSLPRVSFVAVGLLGVLLLAATSVVGDATNSGTNGDPSANVLANGQFAGKQGKGAPAPWQVTLTTAEVNHAPQGAVDTVVSPFADGENAVRLSKLGSASYWPQVWSPTLRLEPGPYEFSVAAVGTLSQMSLRASAIVKGQRVKLDRSVALSDAPETLRHAFVVPEGSESVSVGFGAPAANGGYVIFGRAVLRRLARTPANAVASLPPGDEPDPDPVQGLDSFMRRHGHKPYELFERGEELATLRLIFEDRQFGTPVWMLDTSPTVDHAGTASVWSAWNPTATSLFVEGARPLGDQTHKGWFIHSDYSRMRPSRGGRPAVWLPEDPDRFYSPASPTDGVTCTNWRTGEQEVIAQWEPLAWPGSGQRIYGLTRDGRHIFIDLPNRGIFVPFKPDEEHPIPALPLYDGRPIGPGGESVGGNHYCVMHDHPKHGDLIALRTGMLIDRKTGEKTYVAVPLCGNTNYLRAFHENRVKYPNGDEWNAYGLPWFAEGVRLPTGLSMEELYDLWLNTPHATHGHESTSPDWQYIASDGGATQIVRVRDGEVSSLRLSPNGGNYHLHWRLHPRFFVGWVRGWHFGSYLRPVNANVEFQVFCDGTFQPIVDTKHRLNGYYAGGDFSMLSPDCTKIHYGSSMTGRFRNYIAVMARPRPPVDLSWRAEDGAVVLAWKPSAYSRETRGYVVYRSERSGEAYRLLTPDPFEATTWRDTTVKPGQAYCYVVGSVEHSGLESGYSVEAARAGVDLPAEIDAPLTVYAEPEAAIRDLSTDARPGLAMGVDRRGASDWYYLYRHPEAKQGEAELQVCVPAAERYYLWARVRSTDLSLGNWEISVAGQTMAVSTEAGEWTWARALNGPLALEGGSLRVKIATAGEAAQIDLLCLTTDGEFVPNGPRPENMEPPAAVKQLQVDNVQPRVNRLAWQPSDAANLAYYHVYAASEPFERADPRLRIGSPTEAEMIDWGLEAG
ncbi:MAG: fibronectin type III domain-containing protein, partial [Patescibacteria group bacterium]|nr:fibronectin type III domain-containing protein [Patescibacteria group bacterium]